MRESFETWRVEFYSEVPFITVPTIAAADDHRGAPTNGFRILRCCKLLTIQASMIFREIADSEAIYLHLDRLIVELIFVLLDQECPNLQLVAVFCFSSGDAVQFRSN